MTKRDRMIMIYKNNPQLNKGMDGNKVNVTKKNSPQKKEQR